MLLCNYYTKSLITTVAVSSFRSAKHNRDANATCHTLTGSRYHIEINQQGRDYNLIQEYRHLMEITDQSVNVVISEGLNPNNLDTK